MGTNDNLNWRIEHARDFNHTPRAQGIRHRDNQHGGPSNMGLYQHRRLSGVPRYRVNPSLAQAFNEFAILFGDNKRNTFSSERFGNTPADTTIAHQHDVARNIARRYRCRQFRQRIGLNAQGCERE